YTPTRLLQHLNSMLANLYLRAKYGRIFDVLGIPLLIPYIIYNNRGFLLQKKTALQTTFLFFSSFFKFLYLIPCAIFHRYQSSVLFTFVNFHHTLRRNGDTVKLNDLTTSSFISIIHRTYIGRD